jgi:hypothetical protein
LGLAVLRLRRLPAAASSLPSTDDGHPGSRPGNARRTRVLVLLCQSKGLLPLCPILQGPLTTGAVCAASRRAALAGEKVCRGGVRCLIGFGVWRPVSRFLSALA